MPRARAVFRRGWPRPPARPWSRRRRRSCRRPARSRCATRSGWAGAPPRCRPAAPGCCRRRPPAGPARGHASGRGRTRGPPRPRPRTRSGSRHRRTSRREGVRTRSGPRGVAAAAPRSPAAVRPEGRPPPRPAPPARRGTSSSARRNPTGARCRWSMRVSDRLSAAMRAHPAAVAVFVSTLAVPPPGAPADERVTYVRCGRLFDGTSGSLREGVAVVVRGDTIADVGPGLPVPEGATVLDLAGFTVVPGLIDAHTHVALHPGSYDNQILRETPELRAIHATARRPGHRGGRDHHDPGPGERGRGPGRRRPAGRGLQGTRARAPHPGRDPAGDGHGRVRPRGLHAVRQAAADLPGSGRPGRGAAAGAHSRAGGRGRRQGLHGELREEAGRERRALRGPHLHGRGAARAGGRGPRRGPEGRRPHVLRRERAAGGGRRCGLHRTRPLPDRGHLPEDGRAKAWPTSPPCSSTSCGGTGRSSRSSSRRDPGEAQEDGGPARGVVPRGAEDAR